MDPLLPLSGGVLSALPQQKPQLSLNTPYPAQLLQDVDPVLRLQVGGRELRLPLHYLPTLPLAQPLTVSVSLSQGTSLQLNLSLPTASVTVPLTPAQVAVLQDPKALALLTQQLNRGETPSLAGSPVMTSALSTLLAAKIPLQLNLNASGELSIHPEQPAKSLTLPLSVLKEPALLQSLVAEKLPLMKQWSAATSQESTMKPLNLDQALQQLSGVKVELSSAKLQAGADYFARLQINAKQGPELLIQTAQGPVRLPLQQLPAIPSGVPLLLQMQPLADGGVQLQVKVLAGVATEVPLSSAQLRLLQDPKQLALLQQQLSRGEAPPQLAGEPFKLPTGITTTPQTVTLQLLNQLTNNTVASKSPAGSLSILQIAAEQQLQLSQKDLLKPLPWQTSAAERPAAVNLNNSTGVAEQGWRQLLPLLSSSPARLAALPEMPPAVVALLQQIRQAQPDGQRVLTVTEVQQQLQAVLQFQPLQLQPNTSTGAGTLAIAIQLLLGHLLRQPSAQASRSNSATQTMAQQIGQLDSQQASQLLRALGSHSSLLQLSQLQNADLPQLQQQWFIPLALQQQQESRISEILLEQREAKEKSGAGKQKHWQLTMKFDLGHYGQLLVVAKLAAQDLQLQFYTDQPAALKQAEKFLPLLTERCQAQGLNVSQAACQLGKIPDTLGSRRTSLIATQA